MIREIKLEQFQGPLDLLLQLIEQEELNITEISLAKVTGQYFDYLKGMKESDFGELADFLVIAAKLVYLKSRRLLPYLQPEEDEGPGLAEQLKMYARYREASRQVEDLWNSGKIGYGRVEPALKTEEFILPNNARPENLRAAMVLLLNRLKPASPLPRVTIDRGVSVRQKIEAIFDFLKRWRKFGFGQLFKKNRNKTEVIVSFLALLELVKQEQVSIRQETAFAELEIQRI